MAFARCKISSSKSSALADEEFYMGQCVAT